MKSIFNATFGLLHFGFGGSTNPNNSNTTGKLSKTFAELFFIVFAFSLAHLSTNLFDTLLNGSFIALATNDSAVFAFNANHLSITKHFEFNTLKGNSKIFADELAACKNSDITKHCFATITKTRSFNCANIQNAT